ncbi:hypothetical protein Tco_0922852 [Tanacetum coccineum]|uniref:Uncharacterized protein n=1 Tax=Tanacetum coccineum TaxID=301880 RepID=A0ABQ5D1P6_9ASTR
MTHLPAQTSEVPIKHQPNPSPRPSPTTTIPDSILETSGENLGGHSSSDKSLSGNEGDMSLQSVYVICLSLCDSSKEILLLMKFPEDTVDHIETENTQNEGRTREVDEDKEIDENILSTENVLSTDKDGVSTDMKKVSTNRPIVSTDGSKVSTDRQNEGTEKKLLLKPLKHPLKNPLLKDFGTDETIAIRRLKRRYESESEYDGLPEELRKSLKQLESDERWLRKIQEERSEAIRNRPPTKNQLRNQMMTYLKHVGNFKHAELKNKKFEEVQALYEKIKRSDEDFISIGSAEDERMIKRMNEKGVDSSKDEMIKEESKEEVQEESKEEESKIKMKLPGTGKRLKSRKRRNIQNTSEDDSDKENDELRLHLTIAPDEEKEVDYEILDRKYPIKEWKVRSVLRGFGHAVYQLVMDRYQDETPEGFDRVLWGDLMVMFNPDDENEFWNSQLDWIIVSWKLHSSSGVHTLVTRNRIVISYDGREEVYLRRMDSTGANVITSARVKVRI